MPLKTVNVNMKKTFLLLATLPFLLLSCKKESLNKVCKNISGEWEFETFSGYPFIDTIHPPGNGRILSIRTNGNFEEKKSTLIISKGNFELKRKKDCYREKEGVVFIRNNEDVRYALFIKVVNNKLYLSTSSCLEDGGSIIYRRIGN
jgi:hypothetical protein